MRHRIQTIQLLAALCSRERERGRWEGGRGMEREGEGGRERERGREREKGREGETEKSTVNT